MDPRPRRPWPFDVAILIGSWIFLGLLHPVSKVFWLTFDWVVYQYLSMPLTLSGAREAIQWDATVLYSFRPRPVRALETWLSVKAFGCSPFFYHVVSVLAAGIAIWAVARIALRVTGRQDGAAVVAIALAVSYATGFFLIGYGFALGAAPAFLAVAAYFEAGVREGIWRVSLIAAGVVMLGLAALSHDTFAALALVPLAWAVIVRRDRASGLGAIPFVAVPVAVGLLGRSGMPVTNYGAQIGQIFAALRAAPEVVAVNPARVLITLLSGGIPADALRALPYFPAYSRIRDLLVTPAGVVTIAVVVAPVVGLTAMGLAACRRAAAARTRALFAAAWLAVGSLPLLLPIATPEAFHITGALPGFFLLWTSAFAAPPRSRRAVAWALLGLFVMVQGGFRFVLFHRDLPAMERPVLALQRLLSDRARDGHSARILFFPAQIGGHYAMMPMVAALYRDERTGACVRGDRINGCLVEPLWIWTTFGAEPPIPSACQTSGRVRVGPLTRAQLRLIEESRTILSRPDVKLATRPEGETVRTCPLVSVETTASGDGVYRFYATGDESAGTRWYRYSGEQKGSLIRVEDCPVPDRTGAPGS
jgi:hypothetical protein